MPIDLVKSSQHLSEGFPPNEQHRRKADGRVHRVATTHEVPEPEHRLRIDTEGHDRFSIGRDGHHVAGHGLLAEGIGDPSPDQTSIGHGLERREGLRRDHHQGSGRIEPCQRYGGLRTVDIGDEPSLKAGHRVATQSLGRHHGSEIGAADADVDDGGQSLARGSGPRPRSDRVGELTHCLEYFGHVGRHVMAIDNQFLAWWNSKGDVQHLAVFGGIDRLTAEHRRAPLSDPRRSGQLDQVRHHLTIDQVLRQVHCDPGHLVGERGGAAWIIGEHLGQRGSPDPLGINFECSPGRRGGRIHHRLCHAEAFVAIELIMASHADTKAAAPSR